MISKNANFALVPAVMILGCGGAVEPGANPEQAHEHAPLSLTDNSNALECFTDDEVHPEIEEEAAAAPVSNAELGEVMNAIVSSGAVPVLSFDAGAGESVIAIADGEDTVSVFGLSSGGRRSAELLATLERKTLVEPRQSSLRDDSYALRNGVTATSTSLKVAATESDDASPSVATLATPTTATWSWPDANEPGGDFAAQPVTAQSVADALDGLSFPSDMPPLHVPELESCNASEAEAAIRAWALSHHHVWRLWQLIEFLGESGAYKDDWWVDGYNPNAPNDNWSPRAWFGSYKGYRFEAIRRVVDEYWDRFRTGTIGGAIDIRLKCTPTGPGNVCNTSSTWGHHWVVGFVNLCEEFFDASANNDPLAVQTVMHEVLHHTEVQWKDNLPRSQMIGDVHIHGHDTLCLNNVSTDYMVNPPDALHLASMESCFHRNIGMRNIANYSYNAQRLGEAVMSGALHHFPITPPPPSNSGQSGNGCSTAGPSGSQSEYEQECVKIGQEWVCPFGGGGGPVTIPSDCLLLDTPFDG